MEMENRSFNPRPQLVECVNFLRIGVIFTRFLRMVMGRKPDVGRIGALRRPADGL
jgi:hypothetical protein